VQASVLKGDIPMTVRILVTLFAILLLGACATPTDRYYGGSPGYATSSAYSGGRYASCHNCGVVQRIEAIRGTGSTSGAGAALGGVVGGVVGSQVGSGSGRTAATIAGAAGGAAIGHNIERNRVSESYELTVQMDDGRHIVIHQRDLRGVRPGARVQIVNGQARLI
jgi:outer membrane lipoprotein SlyB